MDERLKHRLLGAAVLVSLGVIFIPMVLDNAGRGGEGIVTSNIPPRPAEPFSSRVVPIGEPVSRLEEEAPPVASVESDGIYGALPDPLPPIGAPAEQPPPEDPLPAASPGEPQPTASAPAPAPVPAPAPPAGEAEHAAAALAGKVTAWAVQLGSFSNAQNAIALRDRLRSMGYTAFVESAPVKERRMTRVFVGPELVRGEAVQILEKLRTETNLKGIVVRYPAG